MRILTAMFIVLLALVGAAQAAYLSGDRCLGKGRLWPWRGGRLTKALAKSFPAGHPPTGGCPLPPPWGVEE